MVLRAGTRPGDGSQGYIGSVLVQHLRSHGYDVVEKDLGLYVECRYPSGAIEPLGWDVREAMPADFQGVDAVVHLAALSNDPLGDLDPALTYEINHDGTMRVAEAARDAGVKRFVFACPAPLWVLRDRRASRRVGDDGPADALRGDQGDCGGSAGQVG